MTLKSCAYQSLYINLLADLTKKQDKLIGQSLVQGSNVGSNKASTFFETLTPFFVLSSTKDLFTKFIKAFVELSQF